MRMKLMRILISGIPGSGKTTLGDFLARDYGFVHIDMEEQGRGSAIVENSDAFIYELHAHAKPVVMTWGFAPDEETISVIRLLASQGFLVFWFDGDLNAARAACIRRGGFDEQVLQRQLQLIEQWDIARRIGATVINVFDAKGAHRNPEEIALEIGVIG